jgi:glycerol-3-phosphate dehydrogenase
MNLLDRSEAHSAGRIRLVRGSHIVLPRLFDHEFSYFFQLPDGRIFFAIPYEQDFTLVGTTDRDHDAGPDHVTASEEEIAYLCDGVNFYFRKAISPSDVIWTFSGVRPLFDDGSEKPEAATRGYRLELTPAAEGAPMLSIFGGKITTYRHLAQEAVDLMTSRVPQLSSDHWTDKAALPGGDFPIDGAPKLVEDVAKLYPFMDRSWAARLVRSYGTLTMQIFGDAKSLSDCGQHFGHGLTEREVCYLIEREWGQTADDILWRRSKLGLHFKADQVAALDAYLKQAHVAASAQQADAVQA